jgi:hypothetical protein
MRYIVQTNDIDEINKFEPGSWFWDLNDFASEWLTNPRRYYSLAIIYSKYLDWLSSFKIFEITNAELALIKVYEGEILKNDNTKLYKLWGKYRKKVNRTGTEDTKLKNKNKVELFEKVIEKLSGECKTHAVEDLKVLKINIDNQGFV